MTQNSIIDPYLIIGTLSGSHSFDTLWYVLFLTGLHTAELHGALGVICPEGTLLLEVCLVEPEVVIPQQGLYPGIDLDVVKVVHRVHVTTAVVDVALELQEMILR